MEPRDTKGCVERPPIMKVIASLTERKLRNIPHLTFILSPRCLSTSDQANKIRSPKSRDLLNVVQIDGLSRVCFRRGKVRTPQLFLNIQQLLIAY